jgi:RHS repeat-associated protein
MDRLITKAAPEGTLNYTYDAAGHLASMTSSHTNGVSVSYTYDSLNRMSTVVDSRLSGNQTTTYTYDAANNVTKVVYPNEVETDFTYDELNRVKQLATSQTGYMYTFDAVGNRKTASELNGRSVSWSFDGIYRLSSEGITGATGGENGNTSYGLDPVGNRQSATSSIPGLSPVGGTFNADDELSGESYDSDGNVTASGGKTFSYDTENHLVSMNGSGATIVYDGDGNRVEKVGGGVTTQYLVDDLNPTGYPQVVEELSSSGAVQREYTYGLQRISENQLISSAWTPSFYGYDGFGTVRQLTNSSGTITDSYDYDAFGNKINSTGTTPNNYLYRGEQYDPDLGLYYLRARYYNTATGRFMSRDPEEFCDCSILHPAALHKYIYGEDDPIDLSDPSGRAAAPLPTPEPAPEPTQPKTAGLEYLIVVGVISLTAQHALPPLRNEINCMFDTEGGGLNAVSQYLGSPQQLIVDWATCSATSSGGLPHVPPAGPYKAPFVPTIPWAAEPGNPWQCTANAEFTIVEHCSRKCPDGGQEWFTYDPGTKYGEPPHWDWHRCDNTTCKIYVDGSSTCAP